MSDQNLARRRVVDVACSWIGTPYHTLGRIKGPEGGVDCLTLLAEVYREAGLIQHVDIPHYSPDFMLHRSDERYLQGLLQYTREVEQPCPGDIALWKFGRCFSHAAIVVRWPRVLHAYVGRVCVIEDVSAANWLNTVGENTHDKGKRRPLKFFSPWS